MPATRRRSDRLSTAMSPTPSLASVSSTSNASPTRPSTSNEPARSRRSSMNMPKPECLTADPTPTPSPMADASATFTAPTDVAPVKRGRGRPPKRPRDPNAPPPAPPVNNYYHVAKKTKLMWQEMSGAGAVRKQRPSNDERKEKEKHLVKGDPNSPIKTRHGQKRSRAGADLPKCAICKRHKGDLFPCSDCKKLYHLRKCVQYTEDQVRGVERRKKSWKCGRCCRCHVCDGFVADSGNVECGLCARPFHAHCTPKKHQPGSKFYCSACIRSYKDEIPAEFLLPTPPHLRGTGGEQDGDDEEGTETSTPLRTWRRGRKPKVQLAAVEAAAANHEYAQETITRRNELFDTLFDLLEAEKAAKEAAAKSPRKRKSASPDKALSSCCVAGAQRKPRQLAMQEDMDMFLEAKRVVAEEEAAERAAREGEKGDGEQWVYIGDGDKMKAIYSSPYPPEMRSSPAIHVCPFCLKATHHRHGYLLHMKHCVWRHPPGDEIYRDAGISFFEVDGAHERLYCRNLCLMAKLFISSKTLHHEVETFLFYVLTENTDRGCQIVGYFSKEKNPSKNNNLSCLLTLPNRQRSGYGRLLIDMSYELSRVERRVGSPEHPLSDLGLLAYRGYWRASLLSYLRSTRSAGSSSIKHMSLATRIHPTDIVNQLMRDRLLVYKDGNYFVKTGKRAFKWPLCMMRRRCIDAGKLKRQPTDKDKLLDPTKLNYYV